MGRFRYDEDIESALAEIESRLKGEYPVSLRFIGELLLQGDSEIEKLVREREGSGYVSLHQVVAQTRAKYSQPLSLVLALQRQQEARRLLADAVIFRERLSAGFAERLSRATMNPITGIPILLLVLYFGLYQFVGVFGAGTLVDFLEGVFEQRVNPVVNDLAAALLPWRALQDLFAGDYGIITLGLRYAIAIILPIVGTFFIAFSIIEDSGYLPRLAMLVDRLFKGIGLNGRAVIPLVLGFGCDTMATVVTRTLETRRERVLSTLLLALAIPCSAQMGVIFAILAGNPGALLIWGGMVGLVLLLVGYIASRILPGTNPSFYMEIPPLRLPQLSNVLVKTYSRMEWYFTEVLPIFILASILIWLGKLTGLFDWIIAGLEPLVSFVGLPQETAVAFLFGFFRRDYGAAGLYDLASEGILSGTSLVVAAVTLTLFVPCIAQFAVMTKERGVKTALAIALFIFPFAFAVGFLLNQSLQALGVSL
jgi:ferrous iron transport protein B